jgi:hypothetical protein
VLGDQKQFSDKTTNALGSINAKYAHGIIEAFRHANSPDADTLNRLKMLNIKASVPNFVE